MFPQISHSCEKHKTWINIEENGQYKINLIKKITMWDQGKKTLSSKRAQH